MPNTTTTPNMSLTLPNVSQQTGPEYASNVNDSLTTVDAHDHSSGQGVQITPSGLNINSDLPFGGNNATSLRSTRFSPQGTPLSAITPDLGCVYVSGVDLYYNDVNGNQIRVTSGGGLVGTPGSITGLTSPASVTYVSANQSFVFQSAANTAADLDGRNFILRNSNASSFGLTLQPPTSMGANFSITLPSLPGSQSFVTLDASGNLAAPVVFPLATAGIANGAVTRPKLQSVGQVTSSSSGSFATTSTSPVLVLQTPPITFSGTGRPVMVRLNASVSGATSYLSLTSSSPTLSGVVTLSRTSGSGSSASDIAQYELGVFDNSQLTLIPSSSVNFFDTSASSGSWNYQAYVNVTNAAGTFNMVNAQLVVYEM